MVLVPAMAESAVTVRRVRPRRVIETTGVGVGALACIATSPPPQIEEFYPSFEAPSFIHNASDQDISVLMRPLRADAQIDCFEIALDPGGLLRDGIFGTGERWTMPPRTNIPVYTDGQWGQDESRDCQAMHISGDRIEPTILFWDTTELPWVFVDGQTEDVETLPSGGVVLEFEDDVFVEHRSTGLPIHYDPRPSPAREGEACELLSDGERVDWSPISPGQWEIVGFSEGVDGCDAVTLASAFGSESQFNWYLCLPDGAFPFTVGNMIEVQSVGVSLRIDGVSQGEPAPSLFVSRGGRDPQVSEVRFATATAFSCEYQIDDACGTVEQPTELLITTSEETISARAGDPPLSLALDAERQLEVWLAYGSVRHALAADCAEGRDQLGDDVEFVTLLTSAN